MLANRLKHALPVIIGKSQSAFVVVCLITNNIILAFEAFHWLNTGNQRHKEHMSAKLDMSKAYDRI